MASIGDFINTLAQKAGVASDNEELKNVLSAPDLQKIVIPDELVTIMDNNLFSVQTAKNMHPEVKNHYFGIAYKGLDAELEKAMVDLGLDDETMVKIREERSSPKRAALLAKTVKELEASKKPAENNTAKEELQKLHNELKAEKDKQALLEKNYQDQLKQINVKNKLSGILGQYKTVYDDMPADVKELTLQTLLNKALQDNDAELTVDDKGGLALIKKDGTNLFGDNHTQLTPQSFLDKVLSQNKILKVSDPKSDNTPPGPTPTPGNPPAQGLSSTLKAELEESRRNYDASVRII